MVPCFICGRNTDGGWVKGFPPAPDSQKLGLCDMHNTAPNREKVSAAWSDYLLTALNDLNSSNAYRAKVQPRLLSIFFTGGGSISVPCLSFSTPNQEILKVITPQNEAVYFPLRQVRHYALAPLNTPAAEADEQPRAEVKPDPALPEGRAKAPAQPATAATAAPQVEIEGNTDSDQPALPQ